MAIQRQREIHGGGGKSASGDERKNGVRVCERERGRERERERERERKFDIKIPDAPVVDSPQRNEYVSEELAGAFVQA
jgi:hypothetical protein